MQFKLTAEILARSVSKDWGEARREWVFAHAIVVEEGETCLCGKYPIKEICTIRNRKNGRLADVGNCCVKKFMAGADGGLIFQGMKRVLDNPELALNQDALDYAIKQGWLNDWEHKFYDDTRKKPRKGMSKVQMPYRVQININVLQRFVGQPRAAGR